MTAESATTLKSFFSTLWGLLGSITIPGTFLTGQHLLMAPLGALCLVTVLKKILDIGAVSVGSSVKSFGSWRGSSDKGD